MWQIDSVEYVEISDLSVSGNSGVDVSRTEFRLYRSGPGRDAEYGEGWRAVGEFAVGFSSLGV